MCDTQDQSDKGKDAGTRVCAGDLVLFWVDQDVVAD